LFEAFEKGLAATLEFNPGKIPDAVEHPLSEFHLVGEAGEHPVFDGVFGDKVDNGDGPALIFAPSAGDALFEFRRIPGQVAVDEL
jgi:hypothetical protein